MITYGYGFTGRGRFSETFADAGRKPHVVSGAADTGIIRTHVHEQMGTGNIASMAPCDVDDGYTCSRDVSHLFPWTITRTAYLGDKYLRQSEQKFIELFPD